MRCSAPIKGPGILWGGVKYPMLCPAHNCRVLLQHRPEESNTFWQNEIILTLRIFEVNKISRKIKRKSWIQKILRHCGRRQIIAPLLIIKQSRVEEKSRVTFLFSAKTWPYSGGKEWKNNGSDPKRDWNTTQVVKESHRERNYDPHPGRDHDHDPISDPENLNFV